MDGVDNHRYAGKPANDPAVNTRLRGVGVEDVGPLRPEDPPQLHHGFEIPSEIKASGRVVERDVNDPPFGELRDELSRGGYADRVTSEIADLFQLGENEISQTQIDRCQVSNAQRWFLRHS
jgi:hypothetical protein